MIIMVVCLPIPGYLAKILQRVEATLMQKTDARVQTATEMMSVLRMIKMFGWEGKIAERLSSKRAEELRWFRYADMVILGSDGITLYVGCSPTRTACSVISNSIIPILQMVVTYGVFTLVMGGRLTRMPNHLIPLFRADSVLSIYRLPEYVSFHDPPPANQPVILLGFAAHSRYVESVSK